MGVMKAEIPPEITEFKERFFLGLTFRQLLCAAAMLLFTVPTGIFGSKIMPKDVVEYIVVLEAIPFAAIGWVKYNDMPFEKAILKVIQYMFGKQKRKLEYLPPIMDTQKQLRDIAFNEEVISKKKTKKIKHKKGSENVD